MTRKYVIGGNWKCNGTVASVKELVDTLSGAGDLPDNVEVIVAPTNLHVPEVLKTIRKEIKVSLQNIGREKGPGAYTGEICAPIAKDFGLEWVITGHSERRVGFGAGGESSDLVAEKTKVAIDTGLSVIACVGESLEEREAGNVDKVVLHDHMAALAKTLGTSDWAKVVVAYEPVWAIGTGKTASPAQAQEVHAAIRNWVAENVSPEVAGNLRIIYGGSVKGSNAAELGGQTDIDGFLVGGASLKPEFIDIIKAVAHQ